ncbi:hypothetical protein F383_37521 [Gossypium arboreum]|uniref:Uncharacterized protein n=1 Tax=Gossypium arboreum TaxID=29729 RepID=A0A0B0M8L2_GOSAR|nr:hypothetical protein F383_37521 [Gossypium arboreum]
MSEVCGSAYLK